MLQSLFSLKPGRWIPAILVVQSLAIIGVAYYSAHTRSSDGCVSCHADKNRMNSLGYPFFAVTQEQAEKESRHPGVKCHECHGGDGSSMDAESAHRGMLGALYLDNTTKVIPRKNPLAAPLVPTGGNPVFNMLPKRKAADGSYASTGDVMTVLLHDRNPVTLGYDPAIGKKACGASSCHPDQVEQFSHTVMGANFRQRTMRSWLKPYGPYNCGPSFADTPAGETAVGNKFAYDNQRAIANELNVPFGRDNALQIQRYCNLCHVGCLDCHYTPFKGEGAHGFSKKPPAESCLGGGRGMISCHTGTAAARRGGHYLGGDFSVPHGLEPDVHVKEKIVCVDCHITGLKGMGDAQRKAVCGDCHIEVEDAIAASEHRNVTCAACHVKEAGGYQINPWGPGTIVGIMNPMRKYYYYGFFSPALIMKDQAGNWIPVKAWPNSVANFKETVAPSEGVLFHWPNGETRDSYILLGSFDGLPDANRHLAWIEIEQVSHPYGKSRECDSCHAAGGGQSSVSKWEFKASGLNKFSGSYKVTANSQGIHIHDFTHDPVVNNSDKIRTSFFAPWLYLGDIWKGKGDFSIPGKGYDKAVIGYDEALKKLESLKPGLPEKRYKKLRAILLHNPEAGVKAMIGGSPP